MCIHMKTIEKNNCSSKLNKMGMYHLFCFLAPIKTNKIKKKNTIKPLLPWHQNHKEQNSYWKRKLGNQKITCETENYTILWRPGVANYTIPQMKHVLECIERKLSVPLKRIRKMLKLLYKLWHLQLNNFLNLFVVFCLKYNNPVCKNYVFCFGIMTI